jgi:uncharacterized protein DUF5343
MAQKFPYTPTAGALVQLLGQLRKSFPATVDSAMLKKLGLAPNNESYNLSVIRFLGLIDEKGAKNPKHQSLFSIADDAKFSEEFSKLVHTAYGELFKLHSDAAWELSKPSLSTFFRQSDGTSAVVGDRQVATFVALAEMSGKRSSSPRAPAQPNDGKKKKSTSTAETSGKTGHAKSDPSREPVTNGKNKTEFSRDVGISVKVEVILPSDASAETYENIFRSIRKNLIE